MGLMPQESPVNISPVLVQMRSMASQWEAAADQRSIFLTCYAMMTANMLVGVTRHEFDDSDWVDHMVQLFAGYYFDALAAYDSDPTIAPQVWRLAHDTCREDDVWVIQKLLLGINAHINYDLVLTLDEMLGPEWAELPDEQRAVRLRDYQKVNDIIARTVDAVQDEVLAKTSSVMRYVDLVLGPGDEFVLSRLLFRWRDRVWDYGVRLVEADTLEQRETVIREMEADALRRANAIRRADGPTAFRELFR